MRLLLDGDCSGPENMTRDEALLANFADGAQAMHPSFVQLDSPLSLPWSLPRSRASCGAGTGGHPHGPRITGGGTIYHIHEVTYSIVARLGETGFPSRLRDAYPLIHGAISQQLALHGASLKAQPETVGDRRYHQEVRCFASPAADDLVNNSGAKALGSAGRNRDGIFLVHGSLKLASNDWDLDVAVGCGVDAETARSCIQAAFASITDKSRAGRLDRIRTH